MYITSYSIRIVLLSRYVNIYDTMAPMSVTSIGSDAFAGCTGLVKVVLYDGFLRRIGKGAFSGCSSLSSIDIPPSVTEICDNAFAWCRALVKVVLHEGLNKIEDRAFSGCSLLLHVDIPHSVTYIGDLAFRGCAVSIPKRPHCMTADSPLVAHVT